jgi:nucleoside-diphosphate-sugar epimerase
MAILLTGATGFVGLNLAHELIGRGEQVVLFAPAPPPAAVADGEWFGRARFVPGDIRSETDIDRAFAAALVTEVIHAAALTPDVQAEAEWPDAIAEVNLIGTIRLMRAAQRAGVRRVLGVSSVAVYGQAELAKGSRIQEDGTTPQPASLYGITKLAAEQAIRRLGALYGIETILVRLGPCFGVREYPGGDRPLMSPHWQCVEALLAGRECVLPRPMEADWIDATDAAAAVVDLLQARNLSHALFNLGGGAVTTATDWCEALVALRPGFRWRVDPSAATVRYGLERDRAPMDTERLRQVLGHSPHTDGLMDRARRYLVWREGPEGQSLCGARAADGQR